MLLDVAWFPNNNNNNNNNNQQQQQQQQQPTKQPTNQPINQHNQPTNQPTNIPTHPPKPMIFVHPKTSEYGQVQQVHPSGFDPLPDRQLHLTCHCDDLYKVDLTKNSEIMGWNNEITWNHF